MSLKGKGIYVEEYNTDIFKAANIRNYAVDEPERNQVLVKMLAAPVNPSDIYTIGGDPHLAPKCPFFPGFEGVGEIMKTGSEVKSVEVGDWIIPGVLKFGSWRTHCTVPENDVMKIDKSIGVEAAATMYVNPFTAYLLLKDIVDLKEGDTVIQTGANSAVGLALIQIANARGLKTINIIRKRESNAETALKKKLHGLGADVVITDEEMKGHGHGADDWPRGISKPKLAIDSVVGESGSELLRFLADEGTYCAYGLLSGKPLTVNVGDLVFGRKKFAGFSLTRELAENPRRRGTEIAPYLIELTKRGKLQPPECKKFKLQDYKEAMKRATAVYTNVKPLLILDESYLD